MVNIIDESHKNSDLSPAMVMREKAPKKTWFIKRGDGFIFAAEEGETWELMQNRTNWMRRDFKIIGVSDGKTYQRIIRESRAKADSVGREIDALKKEQDRYRKTEEKMIFEDLVKPDDEGPAGDKLRKVREILDDYDKKIDAKEEEFKSLTSGVVKTAFNAELEVARGHIEYPDNQNIITPGASPKKRKKIIDMLENRDEE